MFPGSRVYGWAFLWILLLGTNGILSAFPFPPLAEMLLILLGVLGPAWRLAEGGEGGKSLSLKKQEIFSPLSPWVWVPLLSVGVFLRVWRIGNLFRWPTVG